MMRTAVLLSALGLALGLAAPATAQLSPTSKGPIDVTGDHMEVKNQQCMLSYSGNVEALQDTSRLRADQLDVYAKASETHTAGESEVSTKCGALDRMEAHGSVYFVTPNGVVKGDNALYQADAKTITFTGDVVLSQGKNVVVGNRLVYNTDTEQATMDSDVHGAGHPGRVRSVFYPGSNQTGLFPSAPAKH